MSEYYDKVADYITRELKNSLSYGFKVVDGIRVGSNEINGIVSKVLNRTGPGSEQKNIFVILLFHESLDPSGRAVSIFEYEIASRTIHSVVINLTDIVDRLKRGEDVSLLTQMKIRSVLRNIGIKMNTTGLELNPPLDL